MGAVKTDTRLLRKLIKEDAALADAVVGEAAYRAERYAKASFGTGPAGRAYRIGSRVHVASAPPGPPAVDTGALKASIRAERRGRGRWEVHDGVKYGVHLEFGTRKMKKRPWLRPAIRRVVEEMPGLFKVEFAKRLK